MGNQTNLRILEYPSFYVFISLISGILFSEIIANYHLIILISSGILIITNYFFFRNRLIYTLCGIVLLLVISSIWTDSATTINKYPFKEKNIKNVTIAGKVTNIDLSDTRKLELNKVSFPDIKVGLSPKTKILVYLDTTYSNQSLNPGNYILLKGQLRIPKNIRNPGEFDYREYLQTKGIVAQCFQNEDDSLKILDSSNNFYARLLFDVRNSIYNNIRSSFRHHSIINALVLGERGDLDKNVSSNYKDSGIYHIISISGLHVGLYLMFSFILFARFGFVTKNIAALFLLAILLILADFKIPVTRAVIMAVVAIIGRLLNRDYISINALLIAGILILVINPADLYNPGFHLSFTAVLSILVFLPLVENNINKIKNGLYRGSVNILTITIVVQLGILPVQIYYFGQIAPLVLINNLIALTLLPIVLFSGVTVILFSYLLPEYSVYPTLFTDAMIDILNTFITYSNSILAPIRIWHFNYEDILIYYLLVVIIYILFQYFKTIYSKATLILLWIFSVYIFLYLPNSSFFEEDKLFIAAIDVGQGDATFVRFPDGRTMLIDAGNKNEYVDYGKYTIYPLLNYWNVNKINFALLTHYDSDHAGGYYELIKQGLLDTLYVPKLSASGETELNLNKYCWHNEVEIVELVSPQKLTVQPAVYILNHNIEYYEDSNSRSLITKVVYGETSILFTGDASDYVENYYCDEYGNFLKSNILKTGHHGSKHSTGEQLLDIVLPEYAIISAGSNNRFGHPDSTVLSKLKKRKINFLNTADNGCIIFVSNGEKFTIFDWQRYE